MAEITKKVMLVFEKTLIDLESQEGEIIIVDPDTEGAIFQLSIEEAQILGIALIDFANDKIFHKDVTED